MELQKTFKESYMAALKDAVSLGGADVLARYGADEFDIDPKGVKRLAGVYAPEGLEERMVDMEYDDFAAAKIIYEAFKGISPLLASNEAFWAYLTHTTLFHYTQHRWDNVLMGKATTNYIIDHWFEGEQSLMRNAAASLWWTVHNTVDETRKNPYELTEIMFRNYAMWSSSFGRTTIIRHREAMIGILDFFKDNPAVFDNQFEARSRFVTKYFNRLGAVKQLAYLDREYFRQQCERIKDKIISVTNREQVKNEALYTD